MLYFNFCCRPTAFTRFVDETNFKMVTTITVRFKALVIIIRLSCEKF